MTDPKHTTDEDDTEGNSLMSNPASTVDLRVGEGAGSEPAATSDDDDTEGNSVSGRL
ncbi:MAG TPA: hypothetical protein VGO03_10575 [Acidimicrobiia bacterium]|jgi:hypothetical protein